MKFVYVSRKCSVREDTVAYTEKKFAKLDKFFGEDCEVHIVFTYEKENRFTVEATANDRGMIFRAQATDEDFKYCIDDIIDILIRQIRKHKTKLEKKMKGRDFAFVPQTTDVAEDDYQIIRSKKIIAKPMTAEDAILQMDLLGHDFYIFRSTDEKVCVVYKRRDGGYGLIEAE